MVGLTDKFSTDESAFFGVLNNAGTLLDIEMFGGSRDDQGRKVAFGSSGTAVAIINARSEDFPTTGDALQPDFGGENEFASFHGGDAVLMMFQLSSFSSGMITPGDGGGMGSSDGSFHITFPAGAVSENVTVTYNGSQLSPQPAGGAGAILSTFVLKAETAVGQPVTQFQQPYVMTLTYDDTALDQLGVSEDLLNVY